MKILQLDNNYFRFPEGIKTVEEFVEFVNNSSQKFIKMTMLSEEHSVAPYFIEEDQKTVYVNPLQVTIIEEINGKVMLRIEYERFKADSEKIINRKNAEAERALEKAREKAVREKTSTLALRYTSGLMTMRSLSMPLRI